MFSFVRRHAENILVIAVLTASAVGPVVAGLYANGYWA